MTVRPAPRSTRRRRSRLLSGLVLAALVLGGVTSAGWSGPATGAPAKPEGDLQVLFVLDVSGSMARTPGGGENLLSGAKAAIDEVTASLPSEIALGLRVYGASYDGDDKKQSCADTELLVPPRAASAQAIAEATSGLTPLGDTPIGASLLATPDDFRGAGGKGRRVVVLISDGEDTCHPPKPAPCDAARTIKKQDRRIQVESVGLALRGKKAAVAALRCAARVTGGSYYSADDASGLASALRRIAQESIEHLGPGKDVNGGSRADNATGVKPGAYRDTLRPGRTKWYRFRAPADTSPRVFASVKGKAGIRIPHYGRSCRSWEVRLYNPYGEGGTYLPYGNTAIFDGGVGVTAIGVATTNPLSKTNTGIDFPGVWRVSISLARESIEECSDYLPLDERFPIRFTVSLGDDGPSNDPTDPTEQPSDPATDGTDSTPSTDSTDETDGGFVNQDLPADTSADQDDDDGGTSIWVIGVLALLVGALGVLVVRIVRQRRRGY